MTFVLTTDALQYRDRVWGFLESRLECNVLATVLLAVLDGRYEDVQPRFAYRLDERGDVIGAALRTPPATARALAAAWRQRTGGTTTHGLSMAMHSLQEVLDPARPPRGALRTARADERELMVKRWRDFALEAGSAGAARAQSSVDAKLATGDLTVWDDRGPRSPTSNKIYAEVGYRRCGGWEEYEFESRQDAGLR